MIIWPIPENEYATLPGDQPASADEDSFRTAWKAYQDAHDAWIRTDADSPLDEPARYGSSLHQLYKAADAAVDRLISANSAEAEAALAAIHKLVGASLFVAIAVCLAFGGEGSWNWHRSVFLRRGRNFTRTRSRLNA